MIIKKVINKKSYLEIPDEFSFTIERPITVKRRSNLKKIQYFNISPLGKIYLARGISFPYLLPPCYFHYVFISSNLSER